MLTISLEKLSRDTAATPTTPNMREGQEIKNSGLLIMCGVTERTAANIQLYALYLQTSGITSDPHVVTGNLAVKSSVYLKNNDIFVKKMKCQNFLIILNSDSAERLFFLKFEIWHRVL